MSSTTTTTAVLAESKPPARGCCQHTEKRACRVELHALTGHPNLKGIWMGPGKVPVSLAWKEFAPSTGVTVLPKMQSPGEMTV